MEMHTHTFLSNIGQTNPEANFFLKKEIQDSLLSVTCQLQEEAAMVNTKLNRANEYGYRISVHALVVMHD